MEQKVNKSLKLGYSELGYYKHSVLMHTFYNEHLDTFFGPKWSFTGIIQINFVITYPGHNGIFGLCVFYLH